MAVNDQEDSDFEGSGDTGSGYGDSDNDYETGSGNRCGYVGDDEDYDDEGSGNDLTKCLLDFMLFFCQKQILPFYIIVFSSNMSTPISSSGYDSGSGNMCGYVGDDEDYDDEGSGNERFDDIFVYILCWFFLSKTTLACLYYCCFFCIFVKHVHTYFLFRL